MVIMAAWKQILCCGAPTTLPDGSVERKAPQAGAARAPKHQRETCLPSAFEGYTNSVDPILRRVELLEGSPEHRTPVPSSHHGPPTVQHGTLDDILEALTGLEATALPSRMTQLLVAVMQRTGAVEARLHGVVACTNPPELVLLSTHTSVTRSTSPGAGQPPTTAAVPGNGTKAAGPLVESCPCGLAADRATEALMLLSALGSQAPVTAAVPAPAGPHEGLPGSSSSALASAARSAHLLLPLPPPLPLPLRPTGQRGTLQHTAAPTSASGCAPCTTPCPAVPTAASSDAQPPLLPPTSLPPSPMCLAAAVPLLCNGCTAAVLWLAGPPPAHSAAPSAASGTMPAPGPGSVPPPIAAAMQQQPTAQPSTGTPLLADTAFLRRLALGASLCLLGGDPARQEQLQRLAAALHAVDCAGSMQQLVGALCEAVRVQAQRVLPVPLGVQAMLLPGPKAAVGLAFRRAAPPGGTGTWGGGGGGGGGGPLAMSGAQLVAPRPAASTDGPAPPGIGAGGGAAGEGAGPSESRSRYTLRHVLTSTSAQTTRGPAPGTAAATGTLKRRGTAYGYCTPADPHHPQPTPATPPWHPRPHALAAHNAAPRLDSPLFPAFGGLQTAAAAAVESASDSCPRTMRRAVTSSLHAASGGCSASVAVAVAVVPPSDAAAVAATASAAGVLLSAKALPMANTLLRRLSTVGGRSATEPLRTPTGTTGVDQHVDQQPQCLGGVTSMLVDDCLAFVQEPRNPSEDLLWLFAHRQEPMATAHAPAATSLGPAPCAPLPHPLCATGQFSLTTKRRTLGHTGSPNVGSPQGAPTGRPGSLAPGAGPGPGPAAAPPGPGGGVRSLVLLALGTACGQEVRRGSGLGKTPSAGQATGRAPTTFVGPPWKQQRYEQRQQQQDLQQQGTASAGSCAPPTDGDGGGVSGGGGGGGGGGLAGGDDTLGVYLCYPQQLPAQLLEVVRDACHELCALLLPHAQRKVRHDLAAEYRVLQQASPGSYAVLSTATATGDKTSSASVGKPSGSGGGGGGVATHSGSLSLASLGLALPSGQSAAAHVNVFGGASAGGSSAAPSSVVAGKPGGATEQQLQAEAVRGVASGMAGPSSTTRQQVARAVSAPSSELETAATAGPAAAAVSRQDGDRHSHDPVQQQRQQQQVAGAYQCQELESSGTLVLGRIATADGPSTLTTLTSHEHGHGDEHDTFDMGGATSTNLQLSLMATTAYSTSHANAGTFGTLTHAQLPSSSTLTYPRNARALGLATTTSLVSTAPPSLLQSVLTDGGWAGGDGGGGGSFEPLSSTGVLVVEAADVASSGMHAQVPLLVASMRSTIARSMADTAAAHSQALAWLGAGAGSGAADSDLQHVELLKVVGRGSCGVVFRGTYGSRPVAVKLIEMLAEEKFLDPSPLDEGAAPGRDAGGGCCRSLDLLASSSNSDFLAADEPAPASLELARLMEGRARARTALLRTAMELAAVSSLAHPNLLQVYCTFSNVTVQVQASKQGAPPRFRLVPAPAPTTPTTTSTFSGAATTSGAAGCGHEAACGSGGGSGDGGGFPTPVCMAVVAAWADGGSLATALERTGFLRVPPATSGSGSSGGGGGGGGVNPLSRPRSGPFELKGVYLTLLDVAMALRHLHTHKLIHRDVKADNVLLVSCPSDPRGYTAVLADLGFVMLMDKAGDTVGGAEPYAVAEEGCGTVTHICPEAYRTPARLTGACDIYSFGILMWEMFARGRRPYPELELEQIAAAVAAGKRPPFPAGVPATYTDLARACWAAAPLRRPSAGELVSRLAGQLAAMRG